MQQRWLKDAQAKTAKQQKELVEEKQQRRQREGHAQWIPGHHFRRPGFVARPLRICSTAFRNTILYAIHLIGVDSGRDYTHTDGARLFAVISDEAQDAASTEQITFVPRYVHKEGDLYVVKESFVGFKRAKIG